MLSINPMHTSSFTRDLIRVEVDCEKRFCGEESLVSRLKSAVVIRTCYFAISCFLHAEAVCRAAAACFLTIAAYFSNVDLTTIEKERNQARVAYRASVGSLLKTFSYSAKNKDQQILPIACEVREAASSATISIAEEEGSNLDGSYVYDLSSDSGSEISENPSMSATPELTPYRDQDEVVTPNVFRRVWDGVFGQAETESQEDDRQSISGISESGLSMNEAVVLRSASADSPHGSRFEFGPSENGQLDLSESDTEEDAPPLNSSVVLEQGDQRSIRVSRLSLGSSSERARSEDGCDDDHSESDSVLSDSNSEIIFSRKFDEVLEQNETDRAAPRLEVENDASSSPALSSLGTGADLDSIASSLEDLGSNSPELAPYREAREEDPEMARQMATLLNRELDDERARNEILASASFDDWETMNSSELG